nr:protein masquerade-like [Vanessa tameamea]
MKNIVGVAFLILVTAHLGTSQEYDLYSIITSVGFAYASSWAQDLFHIGCPGVCISHTVSNLCQIVYTNSGCPVTRHCCVFFMHIELNLPNATEPVPLKVSHLTLNIPEDITLTHKETSVDDELTITASIPPTTYKTTDVMEFEEENGKIKDKNEDNIYCPGVCVEYHLIHDCEAYYNSIDLCHSTKRCCVNITSIVDPLPSDLIVTPETTTTVRSTGESPTTTSITSNPEQSSSRECKGKCLIGLFSMFCLKIDTNGNCPSQEKCCLD